MNDLLTIIWVAGAGLLLGMLFFGGLWFTVKKAMTSKRPALWFISSLLLRLGITLGGFYYIATGDLSRLLLCLLGFVIARYLVIWFTRSKHESKIKKEKLI